MHLLVINSGSSSIKFSIFAADENSPQSLYEGGVSGIGSGHTTLTFHKVSAEDRKPPVTIKAGDPSEAIGLVVDAVTQPGVPTIDAVGYRVVHPGPNIDDHVLITADVLHALDQAVTFAPLHDPSEIRIIRETMRRFPNIPHFACFDTIFHRDMPNAASTYAIPIEYRYQGVRRYGFHGLSCESIVMQMRAAGVVVPHRMAIAHLGSGCSVTALVNGHSIDNTMGLTPTGGVVMGTRPGDLDPGIVLYMLRQTEGDSKQAFATVEKQLNRESGISALSGLPNDMRSTREAARFGNEHAKLAIDVFTRSIRKAIGGYSWLMRGLDAIVFTGGIGENDAHTREEITSGLEDLGVTMDGRLNDALKQPMRTDISRIAASKSKTEILVIPAKEDWMIATHLQYLLRRS